MSKDSCNIDCKLECSYKYTEDNIENETRTFFIVKDTDYDKVLDNYKLDSNYDFSYILYIYKPNNNQQD